jgi:hypothetical protein
MGSNASAHFESPSDSKRKDFDRLECQQGAAVRPMTAVRRSPVSRISAGGAGAN